MEAIEVRMMNIEQVFNCVMPHIHGGDDRNSISLVSRALYKLDSITRKHVTVYVHYSPDPYRLSQRFPFIESLTLKGFPFEFRRNGGTCKKITTWVKEIALKFTCLKELRIRGLILRFEDLETLARTRGKDLRVLKISKCYGRWELGLVHVGKYCNQLRILCLDGYGGFNTDEQRKCLHELALHNTVLESLHFKFKCLKYEVEDITLVARKCCKSLVSLKINNHWSLSLLGDAFRHAVRLEDFSGAFSDIFKVEEDNAGFKLPPNMLRFDAYNLSVSLLTSLLPHGNQLRELHLQSLKFGGPLCVCSLIKRYPNLEVLHIRDDKCGYKGLQVIAQFCKKLRKLTHSGWVTHTRLIALAEGCTKLDYLRVTVTDMSNEAMECVGTHLKNLRKFRIVSIQNLETPYTYTSLDNGIRAMLTGCNKLERLDLTFFDGELTDVGLGYIGKYGGNLKHLFLGGIGESDAGLVNLSKGCLKLRKIRMKTCPFSKEAVATFMKNNHSIRFIRVESNRTTTDFLRPDLEF